MGNNSEIVAKNGKLYQKQEKLVEKVLAPQYSVASGQVKGIIREVNLLLEAGNKEGALELISEASTAYESLARQLARKHFMIWGAKVLEPICDEKK